MRIVSLVPSATEALFALGLGEQIVGVTHECDHPPAARRLPQLTRSVVPEGLAPARVDERVREVTERGESLYRLDESLLAKLAPELIVTQALCSVCAVSFDDVRAIAGSLPGGPEVLSLDPTTVAEVLDDLLRLGGAAGAGARGVELRDRLHRRLHSVEAAVRGRERPRVGALEWLDPPYVGGHWVPEMIALAGGEDVAGRAGEKSRTIAWSELGAAGPEVAIVMPCGLHAAEAAEQARAFAKPLRDLGAERVVAVDAAASFSRPGPRLVDGVELLAHLLHPGTVDRPPGLAFATLWG